jgi:hypothetical protein
LLKHHFVRGRGYGRIARDREGLDGRRLLGPRGWRFLWRRTVWRIARIHGNVCRWGDEHAKREYGRALPLIVAGAFAATAGALYELIRPGARPRAAR